MLRRALGSGIRWTLLGGLIAAIVSAGESQAATVLLTTIKPPVAGENAVNKALDALNAGGSSLIADVSLLARIDPGKLASTGNDEIFYYTLKPGRNTQLFGFVDAAGKQIALEPGEILRFATRGSPKASFFGRARPVPEPASVLLLLAGGALVYRSTRRRRSEARA